MCIVRTLLLSQDAGRRGRGGGERRRKNGGQRPELARARVRSRATEHVMPLMRSTRLGQTRPIQATDSELVVAFGPLSAPTTMPAPVVLLTGWPLPSLVATAALTSTLNPFVPSFVSFSVPNLQHCIRSQLEPCLYTTIPLHPSSVNAMVALCICRLYIPGEDTSAPSHRKTPKKPFTHAPRLLSGTRIKPGKRRPALPLTRERSISSNDGC